MKVAFDPGNQLNRGKIAAPDGAALLTVDGVPTRGQADRIVPSEVLAGYAEAVNCNGNGACFTWDPDDAMCPSWKGTRERRHSPKGRAMLVGEWLRRLTAADTNPVAESRRLRAAPAWPARLRNTLARRRGEADFSHQVKEAMDGCLSCKSCAGGCPVKVNVPAFRSRFLELYHGRYLRPAKDHFVAVLEQVLPLAAKMPWLHNTLLGSGPGAAAARWLGLVDTPLLSRLDLRRELAARGTPLATPEVIVRLAPAERCRAVVLVQDAVTTHNEAPLVLDVLDLMRHLGFVPLLAPFRPNGKALHVHGFLGRFERVAAANGAMLRDLAATGVDLVGLDPSVPSPTEPSTRKRSGRAPYRRLYSFRNGSLSVSRMSPTPPAGARHTTCCLIAPRRRPPRPRSANGPRSSAASVCSSISFGRAVAAWQGTYGHETEHRDTSALICGGSWAPKVRAHAASSRLLATGYSCRSQVKRLDQLTLPHPAQVLLAALREQGRFGESTDQSAAALV